MTAAVYRWFLALSGADLLVGGWVLAILAVVVAYALYQLGALLWRAWIEHRIRHHVRQVWPIPYVERPVSHGTRLPALATFAIFVLFLSIWWRCGR